MKTLYLVRHAKSSWKDMGLDDYDRPLNGRGKKEAPQIGKLMAKMNEYPDLIISSPAKRALDTAKKIARELSYKISQIKIDERLYMAGTDDFLAVITDIKKTADKLMIVSHNFGITMFANHISGSDLINMPTCSIVKVSYEIEKWRQLEAAKGNLEFFISPKKDTDGL